MRILWGSPMSMDVTTVLLETIKDLAPEKSSLLDIASARHITLQSFDLDSLDTLKLAMDLEDALGINIEIVNFPDTLTLSELADRLSRQIGQEDRFENSISAQP
jgi:acyl carrier protein